MIALISIDMSWYLEHFWKIEPTCWKVFCWCSKNFLFEAAGGWSASRHIWRRDVVVVYFFGGEGRGWKSKTGNTFRCQPYFTNQTERILHSWKVFSLFFQSQEDDGQEGWKRPLLLPAFRWRLMKGDLMKAIKRSGFTISTGAFFVQEYDFISRSVDDIYKYLSTFMFVWIYSEMMKISMWHISMSWSWLQWQNFHDICRQAACVCYLPESVFFLILVAYIYIYIYI